MSENLFFVFYSIKGLIVATIINLEEYKHFNDPIDAVQPETKIY